MERWAHLFGFRPFCYTNTHVRLAVCVFVCVVMCLCVLHTPTLVLLLVFCNTDDAALQYTHTHKCSLQIQTHTLCPYTHMICKHTLCTHTQTLCTHTLTLAHARAPSFQSFLFHQPSISMERFVFWIDIKIAVGVWNLEAKTCSLK